MSKSLFIGSTVIRLQRVDSSNNYARQLLHDKMPIEGTVIIANEQTSGRGQRSNSWVTEADKNLTCSYILRPAFLAAKDQFMLSAAVALAVFDTISELLPKRNIKIKWPNDLLVGKKKIAGILIENSLRGMNLENSIIGIGLNVNQIDFPVELNATSIQLESQQNINIDDVLNSLSTQLEKYYLQIREGRFEDVLKSLNNNLFGIRQSLSLIINGTEETVTVVGIHDTGELVLERADGTLSKHQHHEITWKLA